MNTTEVDIKKSSRMKNPHKTRKVQEASTAGPTGSAEPPAGCLCGSLTSLLLSLCTDCRTTCARTVRLTSLPQKPNSPQRKSCRSRSDESTTSKDGVFWKSWRTLRRPCCVSDHLLAAATGPTSTENVQSGGEVRPAGVFLPFSSSV